MIIIKSQNGERIIKAKHIYCYTHIYSGITTEYIMEKINENDSEALGKYSTKERAQEVLDEIFKEIKCRAYTPTYEMPKE